jgi:hypothetical protein
MAIADYDSLHNQNGHSRRNRTQEKDMTLRACVDLSLTPPTFDMVANAALIERERVNRGEKNVEIAVAPGPVDGFRGDRFWPFGREARVNMLYRVGIPILEMLPSCVGVIELDRHKDAYGMFGYGQSMHGLQKMLSAGCRPLRARVNSSVHHDDLITITLREAEHWPTRNSNVDAWFNAATDIREMGFRVVVVRDALHSLIPFGDFEINPQASHYVVSRASLYASARLNMGVNNGPMWLSAMMDAPTVIMRLQDATAPCCSFVDLQRCGLTYGDPTLPGVPNTTISWESDTRNNIIDAFLSRIQ